MKTLEARNSTHPMQAFTDMDVGAIGCECMMHFRYSLIVIDSQIFSLFTVLDCSVLLKKGSQNSNAYFYVQLF